MPSVDSPGQINDAGDAVSRDGAVEGFLPGIADSSVCDNGGLNSNADDVSPSEADDDSRKLFVGGLSWQTSENDLRDYFSRWGKVMQCIIKLDRYTGNSRGFGFVTMENEECVYKILSVSDHWLKNKRIDPKKAKPSKETIRKIFVGGIDPDVSECQIREYFSAFGKIESLDLPFDAQKGRRKHYIFVSFASEAAARKAIAKERQEIFGRQCDVRVAVTREQANRQKALKQWSPWPDPYPFAGQPYNDLTNAYFGYDPFLYNYYGCEYTNVAGAPGFPGYSGVNSNQLRGFTSPQKLNQTQRDSSVSLGPGTSNRLLTASGSGAVQNRTQHQPHPAINFSLMNSALDHHAPFSCSNVDFNNPHSPHIPQSIMANSAGGYPHP